MNRHTLFTNVEDYYQNLVTELASAQNEISMTYLSFDSGKWADEISKVLIAKAGAGVRVRLMVDDIGQAFDEPRHAVHNVFLFKHLRANGVQFNSFRPVLPLLPNNRLHCKIAAIDDRTVFLGGSNIGDYYTTWKDTNLRVDGDLGNVFHKLYDFLHGFSLDGSLGSRLLDTSNLKAGSDRIHMTVPRHKQDIRNTLLKLIREADKSVYIRTWYFLPDGEILDALCEQARKGVRVNVLLSDVTRVRPVDFANYIHIHKLVCASGHVYRYMGKYMHSKAAWNNHNDVLFGSANLDAHSMRVNFESCLEINDPKLAWELRRSFYEDTCHSIEQTPQTYLSRPLVDKALSHAFNLASDWL